MTSIIVNMYFTIAGVLAGVMMGLKHEEIIGMSNRERSLFGLFCGIVFALWPITIVLAIVFKEKIEALPD